MGSEKNSTSRKIWPRKHNGENCRHIIAKIKRALTQNQLSGITTAVRHLHNNREQIPSVVNQLNALIGHRHLLFRWLPDDHGEPAALLLRNASIGLLVKTDPNSAPDGMMLTPVETGAIASLTPEAALSALLL